MMKFSIVAMALALVTTATPAFAQSDAPPPEHTEHRANPVVIGIGIGTFVAGYVPWTLEGIGRAASNPQQPSNWDHALIWRVIPVIGPFIAVADYNGRNVTDCYRVATSAPQRLTGYTFQTYPYSTYCTDTNAGTLYPNGQPAVPRPVPRQASGGDWVWASVISGVQIAGIAITIWGLFADTVYVTDHQQAHARNDRSPRWMVMPEATSTYVGASVSAVTF